MTAHQRAFSRKLEQRQQTRFFAAKMGGDVMVELHRQRCHQVGNAAGVTGLGNALPQHNAAWRFTEEPRGSTHPLGLADGPLDHAAPSPQARFARTIW
jgi:hypothetical protein